jgi:transcriptional regulator with XRE-family HTH domain
MATRKKSIHTQEYREIISKLIYSRKKVGLTQIEVADLLNCSQSYISKIENCQIRIDLIQLKVFAELYKTNIQDLLG